MKTISIYHGGMYRCCIQTCLDYSGDMVEGYVQKCAHCHGRLKITSRGWEYDGDYPEDKNDQPL